ncbi:hypothetical protein BD770DRAFT_300448, partial [Pilaira anomala]
NCVFVDESVFDIHTRRSRSWSLHVVEKQLPLELLTSHTIFGSISTVGVVNVSMR